MCFTSIRSLFVAFCLCVSMLVAAPRASAQTVTWLALDLRTGGDDLRGGQDNYNVDVLLKNNTSFRAKTNVNQGLRYPNNTQKFEYIMLNREVKLADIKGVRLATTFGGGIAGDNWNLDRVYLWAWTGQWHYIANAGPKRLTGSDRELDVLVAPPVQQTPQRLRLDFVFRTSDDDLRGGNDNLNIEVTLMDGRKISATNVNQSQRWENYSTKPVSMYLPAGVTVGQIRGIKLMTTFTGGIGGDNWNMQGVEVKAAGSVIASKGFNRFTGSNRELPIK